VMGGSSKFGDSALNCLFSAAILAAALARQLSALSPNLERGW
jgi:hypothetical protein